MEQFALDHWAIVAFILTALFTFTVWAINSMIAITRNVTLATKTLSDLVGWHAEHDAKLDRLDGRVNQHDTKLAVLERDIAANADTGKHPVMHLHGAKFVQDAP